MEDSILSQNLLVPLFFMVALAYSSVGLGGGSSYTALMMIFGINFLAIPTVTLILNIIVTSVGSLNFIRKGHARFRLILPFFISSVPMSYLGGSLKLPKEIFQWILLITLIFVALRIYLFESTSLQLNLSKRGQIVLSLIVGSVLGLVAGIVGIGGGIYLVPLIIILNLGSVKEAAACGAIFTWANSISGLFARLRYNPVDITEFIPLFAIVLFGGIIGSHMGAARIKPVKMQKILGLIIIVAILFLTRSLVLTSIN